LRQINAARQEGTPWSHAGQFVTLAQTVGYPA